MANDSKKQIVKIVEDDAKSGEQPTSDDSEQPAQPEEEFNLAAIIKTKSSHKRHEGLLKEIQNEIEEEKQFLGQRIAADDDIQFER